jgi:DNA-binding response OmpR family regulator
MKNVLIVDDDENILNLVELSLSHPNLSIDKASNGEDALQKTRNKNYDLVVVDLMMPNMDGGEVCKEIRKNLDIPILILSAKDEKEDYLRNTSLRINGFINKPFDPQELFITVKKHLN